MADTTGISWADATFNPWMGCSNVSPGCAHCYAETLTKNRMGLSVWNDEPRQITSASTWAKPGRWARLAREGILPDGRENRDGHRPRVFCASLADVFEDLPQLVEPRLRLFELIHETPELDWLILTKRPEFMRDWFRQTPIALYLPLPNVWLGTSIENARFTWRADVLREIPATVRFISAEPLLGSLFKAPSASGRDDDRAARRLARPASDAEGPTLTEASAPRGVAPLDLTDIGWVIVGGESGPRADARPMHPTWAREIRDAVQAVSIEDEPFDVSRLRPALHMKQWGSWAPDQYARDPSGVWVLPDGRTVTPFHADAFDVDLTGAYRMRYAGIAPGSGGKYLDGTDWCEFPDPAILTPA